MDSTLVSARVPRAKKDAGVGVLASLGATTSDLINCAFDYVLSHHELPTASAPDRRSQADFARFVEESTLPVRWGEDAPEGDYRALIRDRRLADYESLA